MKYKFETIVNHLITSGYVYQGSEIYGGLANTWDYGPLGAELKNNLKRMWWKKFVQESPTNVGVDAAILMNSRVWEATGHVATFNDPLVDCKKCRSRFRADELINKKRPDIDVLGLSNEEMDQIIVEHKITCPVCGSNDFTNSRQFNMMFKTHTGVIEDNKSLIYLRPETAQGIFVNFKNILRTSRRKLPLGVCNIGKSFRNEITPGNFIFRTREFEQAELEFFCQPGTDEEWFSYWKTFCLNFLKSLNLKEENLRYRDHSANELSFYSKETTDIEYYFPFGWGELLGIANRTDYDLKRHSEFSGENFDYLDPETKETYIPYCVEPSFGVDRLMLALMCDAFLEETLEKDTRLVMKLHPALAPYKVAILPLSKQLNEKALEIVHILNKHFQVTYDESGSIGRRYRRQDAIGTPFAVTIDFETSSDQSVTIRERDSMKQIRLPITEIVNYLKVKLFY
ncbi:MAG: glycine--tRNA ligase [Erysipelotrichia bacterium]|jgi:glycyl-tRNA synthetase|nr:glycine--tRNA ligase [Erysipelotrichia bacterium]